MRLRLISNAVQMKGSVILQLEPGLYNLRLFPESNLSGNVIPARVLLQ